MGLYSIDTRGSTTIFPLVGGPDIVEEPHPSYTVVYVNGGHFIHVELTGSYPMPPPHPAWMWHKDEHATGWYVQYEDRVNAYKSLVYNQEDPNIIPEVNYIG